MIFLTVSILSRNRFLSFSTVEVVVVPLGLLLGSSISDFSTDSASADFSLDSASARSQSIDSSPEALASLGRPSEDDDDLAVP